MPVSDGGFTLVECLAALTVSGILLAITAPNLGAWVANSQMNQAISIVESGIRGASAAAIRRNRPCAITFTDNSFRSTTANCPLYGVGQNADANGYGLGDDHRITSNLTGGGTITFTSTGSLDPDLDTKNNPPTIVVRDVRYPNLRPACLVLKGMGGSISRGEYTGNPSGTISANLCQPKLQGTGKL